MFKRLVAIVTVLVAFGLITSPTALRSQAAGCANSICQGRRLTVLTHFVFVPPVFISRAYGRSLIQPRSLTMWKMGQPSPTQVRGHLPISVDGSAMDPSHPVVRPTVIAKCGPRTQRVIPGP